MTTGAFIIARLSSSRLPQKNIKTMVGKPMLQLLSERIQSSDQIDKVIITTSSQESDDPLEELADRLGLGCYRGSLDNIMERICGAAQTYECDTIVEILGDNPLVHSELIDETVSLFKNRGYDYAATVTKEYPVSRDRLKLFSVGVRVQTYTLQAALKYKHFPEYMETDDKHPCAYIFDHPDQFKLGFLEARGRWAFMNRPDLNFAVNYRKNFDLVRSVFERAYPVDSNFSLEKVYELMDQQKHLYLLMGSEEEL